MEAKIKFEQYFIDRIHLDLPALAASGCINAEQDLPENMEMQFSVNVVIDEPASAGKVFLEVVLRPNSPPPTCSNNPPDFITLRIVGIFVQCEDEKIEPEQFRKMCEINGVASLFPFLRAAVAEVTRMSNVSGQILLPLINVPEMMSEMKRKSELTNK